VLVSPQFVADGVFYAELNELLTRELSEDGYSGVEVRVTPLRTEIIIRATRTQNVLGRDRNRNWEGSEKRKGRIMGFRNSAFSSGVCMELMFIIVFMYRRREGPSHS
jgi:hypothetical protein